MLDIHKHALQLISNKDWDDAHHLIQNYNDDFSCLIHGYLHREEGDLSNAAYWYERANQTLSNNSLDEEFARITALINSPAD